MPMVSTLLSFSKISVGSNETESPTGPHPGPERHHVPIDRVLDEILSSIFLLCAWEYKGQVPELSEPPLSLALVSKRWRDVAYSTPSLWSSLMLQTRAMTSHYKQASALAWLERASAFPLDLVVDCRVGRPLESDLEDTLQKVVTRARRVRSLACYVDPELGEILAESFFGPEARSPEKLGTGLREMIFQVKRASHSPPTQLNISEASRLETVQVHGAVRLVIRDNHALHALRFLVINVPMNADDHLHHLRLLPFLWRYTAICGDYTVEDDWEHSPSSASRQEADLIHTQLEYLSITAPSTESSSVGSLILGRLALPRLGQLHLHFTSQPSFRGQRSWPELPTFLRRSKCPLEYLYVLNAPMTEKDHMDCLQHIPMVRFLKINTGLATSGELLRALTCKSPDQNPVVDFVPCVEEIWIVGESYTRINAPLLEEMVRSRWGGRGGDFSSGKLLSVSVWRQGPEITEPWKDCISDGLAVSFVS